jgi:hypothetical protein
MSGGCSRFGGHSDEAIATDIKAKMFSDPALKSTNLNVAVKNGVATLAGEVPDDTARLAAYKLASQAEGVSKVNDQMSVVAAQAALSPAPVAEPAAPEKPRAAKAARAKPKQATSPAPAAAPAADSASVAPVAPRPVTTLPLPPPQPKTATVPAGATLTVRTIDGIDSEKNHSGDVFKGSLDAPIVVDDEVIVPAGADVNLKLVNASSAGRVAGRSELTVELTSFVFQGKTHYVVTNDVRQAGASRGKRSAATIGGGAALGALIGAVAGGGKGAAIGAAVGAGAGTGVQVFTKGQQVRIPSESRLDFKLQQPLDITYLPGKHTRARPSADRPPTAQPPADQPPAQLN